MVEASSDNRFHENGVSPCKVLSMTHTGSSDDPSYMGDQWEDNGEHDEVLERLNGTKFTNY